MTDITWEGDIKLAVISTDVEGRQKCKIQNEQLTWDLTLLPNRFWPWVVVSVQTILFTI